MRPVGGGGEDLRGEGDGGIRGARANGPGTAARESEWNMANGWKNVMAVVVAAGVVWGMAGCFREMISEVELSVPAMASEEAAKIVEKALWSVGRSQVGDNVLEVRTDITNHMVTVRYNNAELKLRNLQVAVRHAGFAVDDLPADEAARAKLPVALRALGVPPQTGAPNPAAGLEN